MISAISWGGVAALIAAGAWALLVLFLGIVLLNLFRVLDATRVTIDDMRKSTVPLLVELRATVTAVNKELDRVDGVMDRAGNVARSAERLAGVVEQTVSGPLIRIAAIAAGASRAARRLRKAE